MYARGDENTHSEKDFNKENASAGRNDDASEVVQEPFTARAVENVQGRDEDKSESYVQHGGEEESVLRCLCISARARRELPRRTEKGHSLMKPKVIKPTRLMKPRPERMMRRGLSMVLGSKPMSSPYDMPYARNTAMLTPHNVHTKPSRTGARKYTGNLCHCVGQRPPSMPRHASPALKNTKRTCLQM